MSDNESSWPHLIVFKVDPAAESGLKQTLPALRGFFLVSSCLFACFEFAHAAECEGTQFGFFFLFLQQVFLTK